MKKEAVVLQDSKVSILCKVWESKTQEVIVNEYEKPLLLNLGDDQIMFGLHMALLGMKSGDKKKITIEPKYGYGEHHSQLIAEIEKKDLPDNLEIKLGNAVLLNDEDDMVSAYISKILDDSVLIDANHPYAGHSVDVEFELVKIL